MENQNQTLEVAKLVSQAALEPETSEKVTRAFEIFASQALEWRQKCYEIKVTDASQTLEITRASEGRKWLKKLRTEADKTRKALKEDSNRYNKAVQTVYNAIEAIILPMEEYLETQERFPEIQEKQRKDALRTERHNILAADGLQNYLPAMLDLGEVTNEDFDFILLGTKVKKEQAEKLAAELEEKRLADEKARQDEQARRDKELKDKIAEQQRIIAEQKKAMDNTASLPKVESAMPTKLSSDDILELQHVTEASKSFRKQLGKSHSKINSVKVKKLLVELGNYLVQMENTFESEIKK